MDQPLCFRKVYLKDSFISKACPFALPALFVAPQEPIQAAVVADFGGFKADFLDALDPESPTRMFRKWLLMHPKTNANYT